MPHVEHMIMADTTSVMAVHLASYRYWYECNEAWAVDCVSFNLA